MKYLLKRCRESSSLVAFATTLSALFTLELPIPVRVIVVILAAIGFAIPEGEAQQTEQVKE